MCRGVKPRKEDDVGECLEAGNCEKDLNCLEGAFFLPFLVQS